MINHFLFDYIIKKKKKNLFSFEYSIQYMSHLLSGIKEFFFFFFLRCSKDRSLIFFSSLLRCPSSFIYTLVTFSLRFIMRSRQFNVVAKNKRFLSNIRWMRTQLNKENFISNTIINLICWFSLLSKWSSDNCTY